MARLVRVIFLLVGVGLLTLLFTRTDLAAVRAYMREMGWAFPLIFLPYITVYLCDTLGWSWAFGPTVRVTFGTLFLIFFAVGLWETTRTGRIRHGILAADGPP